MRIIPKNVGKILFNANDSMDMTGDFSVADMLIENHGEI